MLIENNGIQGLNDRLRDASRSDGVHSIQNYNAPRHSNVVGSNKIIYVWHGMLSGAIRVNYKHCIKPDGKRSSPLIVEGANLFVTAEVHKAWFVDNPSPTKE
jgi:hypothetical protein